MGNHNKKRRNIYDLIDVLYFRRWKYSPRKAIPDLISDEKNTVLDCCSGTGTNSLLIAKNRKQCTVTAIDISAEMLTISKEKAAREQMSSNRFNHLLYGFIWPINDSAEIVHICIPEVKQQHCSCLTPVSASAINQNGCVLIRQISSRFSFEIA